MLQLMAALPLTGTLDIPAPALERAARHARAAAAGEGGTGSPYAASFFTPHEMRSVTLLADLIIPRDARSGSASEAGVPAFIDFMMVDRPDLQLPIRGGLAWLDAETRRRFGHAFIDAADAERTAILDDIAWPARAPATLAHGVVFFNRFRDLVASGFWSSRMGVDDLGFMGNTVVPVWNGCPEPVLRQLGVAYDD